MRKGPMCARILRLSCLLACLIAVALVSAQEGHPLVGSWHGTWGPDSKERKDVTVIMLWDGKNITGMLNPGPEAGPLERASLDPNGWMVHFEADLKDSSGAAVHVIADGKIQNISNVRRAIVGTWVQGSAKGDFRITRDN
jgi:hypothetical protein